jgi:hypothetical protein
MSLAYDFKTAKKQLALLDESERAALLVICREIHDAQAALTAKAAPLLEHCMKGCQGLCCRNIRVADIITRWDLIYVLAMATDRETRMARCLDREGLFAANCLFLENGTGPCIFPENIRPERCIISFCRVEPLIEKEIARVMRGFSRLIRFFYLRPYRRLIRRLRHPF